MSDFCNNRHVILRDLENYLKKGTLFDGYTSAQQKQINENLGISKEIDTKTSSSAAEITAALELKLQELKTSIEDQIDQIVAGAANHVRYIGTFSNQYDILWVKKDGTLDLSTSLPEGETVSSLECSDGSLELSDNIITGIQKGIGHLHVMTDALKDNYDVNGDGEVDYEDVLAVRNFIKYGSASGITKEKADVNGDGEVNTSDIVDLFNYINNGPAKTYLVLCEPEVNGLYILSYKVDKTYFTIEYLFNGERFIELGNEGINAIQTEIEGSLGERTDINTETIATKTTSLEKRIEDIPAGGDIEWHENT